MFRIPFALLLSSLLRPGGSAQETIQEYKARMESAFQAEFDAQDEAPAMWIGIEDPIYGDLFFVFGNSTGGPPPDTPATLVDRFDIGSISKTMGGTLMLLLEEEGVLSLSDQVWTFVPDFATQFPQYANYTLEELLRMETVVPDFLNDPDGMYQPRCARHRMHNIFTLTDFCSMVCLRNSQ